MVWIKITHIVSGNPKYDYINLEQVYKIFETSPTEITFYDANSILPTSYIFASAQEKTEFMAKFESIVRMIDIDNLAKQG